MTDRELIQQALDALKAMQSYAAAENKGLRICDEAIEALRARLAQPEQEPVAWMEFEGYMDEDGLMSERKVLHTWDNGKGEPLYTAPPQLEWQGLTDEEQTQVAWSCGAMSADWLEFAEAIEAKLKEKNT